MSLIECWLIALIAVRARLGVYFSRSPGGWGKACEFGFCQWRRIKPVRGIDSSTSGYFIFLRVQISTMVVRGTLCGKKQCQSHLRLCGVHIRHHTIQSNNHSSSTPGPLQW